jgi:predicted sugar kinase
VETRSGKKICRFYSVPVRVRLPAPLLENYMSITHRSNILKALKQKYEAEIEFHKVNIEILLNNHVGVGEHPDIMKTIDQEVAILAEWEEKLQILTKHF